MSLIHADNFNIYGGSAAEMLADGRYSNSNGSIVTDPDGVSLTKVYEIQANQPLRRALQTPTIKVGCAARYWCGALPANNQQRPTIFSWADAANNLLASVVINTTGSISVSAYDSSNVENVLATTSGPVVSAGAWWHIECVLDATNKTLDVRVEGISKISITSGSFAAGTPRSGTIYQCTTTSQQDTIGASINLFVKDYVWWDGLGSANNTFMGSVLVSELDPISDVTIGGWVPSIGVTAFPILAGNPGVTPYLAANSTPPSAMQVALSPLPANVTSVKGLISLVRAGKVDGGEGNLQSSLISSGTTGAGTDRPITTAQTYWEDIFENDPHTAAPWTPIAVNAVNLKINRTL